MEREAVSSEPKLDSSVIELDRPPAGAESLARYQRGWLRIVAALGGILLGVLTIAVWKVRRPIPDLTPEVYEQAMERWDSRGPSSYLVEIEVSGRQPATYRVVIQNGEAIEATRNGQPLKQRRTMTTWSVPGMFETISSDLENWAKHASGTANPRDAKGRPLLRSEFRVRLSGSLPPAGRFVVRGECRCVVGGQTFRAANGITATRRARQSSAFQLGEPLRFPDRNLRKPHNPSAPCRAVSQPLERRRDVVCEVRCPPR